LGAALAVAFFVSLVVCRAMIWMGPVDEPTEARKQHRAPTPTSGGIGIGAGYGAGLAVLMLFSIVWRHQVNPQAVALLGVSALLAYPLLLVGFIDDARYLRARFKFLVYAVIAVAAAWLIGAVGEIRVGDQTLVLPFIAGLAGTALWVFTLVNAVNFMDGSNGIAMGSVAVGLASTSIIALAAGAIGAGAGTLCGAAALVGFLIWNFPSGRLFAGDSGALFAGAIAAFACLILIERADMSVFVAPILFFPLLADVLLTLLHRARRGKKLLDGHAEHIYQIAIRAGWSHARIAIAYWIAMGVCGAIAISADRDPSHIAPAVALSGLAVLSIVIDAMVRRTAEQRGIL
jgi:UDP-N-acetylmuramyl pentapeptide phosphotransferase/UDP-N-acetylglucosamine-1-phosphate transferase